MRRKSARMSLLRPLRWAGVQFLACCFVVFIRALYVYGTALWNDQHLINFAASWIPGIVSVIIGILPEKDWARMRIHHRFTIIFVGLSWSALLWHQQALTDLSNATTNKMLLAASVQQANSHADDQFKRVKTDVGNLALQVDGLGPKIEGTQKTLADNFTVAADKISSKLSDVTKPEIHQTPKLEFSFWQEDPATKSLTSINVEPDSQGVFSYDFVVTNTSDTAAEDMDIWIIICTVCSFAVEPDGFQKLPGMNEQTRFRHIGNLNAGITYQKTTVKFRSSTLNALYVTQFVASCSKCGKPIRTPPFTMRVLSLGAATPFVPMSFRPPEKH